MSKKIIIANDQEDTCRRIARALQQNHYEVEIASDGWRAIELLLDESPDVVVAALNMPGVNGLGVLAAANAGERTVPVVLTSRDVACEAVDAMRFAARDMLVEPLDADEVRQAVERAIRSRNGCSVSTADLQASSAFRGKLLQMMAHDIGNLVNAVQGFGHLAAAATELVEAQSHVRQILAAVVPIRRMIDDINTYSLIDAQRIELNCETVPLEECIAAAAAALLFDPRVHQFALPLRAPRVQVDRGRTVQIFLNLLGNAIKYSPQGGKITVTASRKGRNVVCCVRDQGMGIPPDRVEALFKPFYRLERDRQSGTPGRGLGLAIVKHLVELQGGEIWVESPPQGGSAFYFTVPAAVRTVHHYKPH